MTTNLKQLCNSVLEAGEKATKRPWQAEADCDLVEWTLGDNSAMTAAILVGPKKHRVTKHFLFADAEFIVLTANNAEKFARALLVMEEALEQYRFISAQVNLQSTSQYSPAAEAFARVNEILEER